MDSIQLNVWAVFYAAVAIQGFIITTILFVARKGNQRANKYLAILLLSFTCTRLNSFFVISDLFEQLPHFIFVATPYWYLLAPLYFLYVKALVDEPIRWNWVSLFHFVPFLAVFAILLPFYVLPAETKYLFWSQAFTAEFGLKRFLFVLAYDLQNLPYLVTSIAVVLRNEKSESGQSMSPARAHVRWLKFLLTFIAFYMLFDLVVAIVHFVMDKVLFEMQYLPMAIFSILVYSISFLAIQEPEKLFPRNLRLRKRALFSVNAQEICKRLLFLMETQKSYRNSKLRYSDLAAQLGISVSQLSKILNQEIGKSFNDFVNTYRVKETKERLRQNESHEYTLLAVAFEAGFNSKASFNRIFKRHTGMTPSQYVKRLKQDSA